MAKTEDLSKRNSANESLEQDAAESKEKIAASAPAVSEDAELNDSELEGVAGGALSVKMRRYR